MISFHLKSRFFPIDTSERPKAQIVSIIVKHVYSNNLFVCKTYLLNLLLNMVP